MGRKTYTYDVNTRLAIPQGFRDSQRQLGDELGGVIFGCTNDTFEECVKGRIFGLPRAHILYVQEIVPGLPLFLFNYSNRRLHGVYRAVSPGLPEINPHGWTGGTTAPTHFPAQVRVELCKGCEPLTENQFKPVLAKNYQDEKHFVFELDKKQIAGLCKLFNCAVPRGPPKEKWKGVEGLALGVSRKTGNASGSGSAVPRVANSLGRVGPSQPTTAARQANLGRESEGMVLNMDEFPALGGGLPAAGDSITIKRVVVGGSRVASQPKVAANRKVPVKEGGASKRPKEVMVSSAFPDQKPGGGAMGTSQQVGGRKEKEHPQAGVISKSKPSADGEGDWQIVDNKKSASKGKIQGKNDKAKCRDGAGGLMGTERSGIVTKGEQGRGSRNASSERLVTPPRIELAPKRVEMKEGLGEVGDTHPGAKHDWQVVGKSKRRGGGGRTEKSDKDGGGATKDRARLNKILRLETGVQGSVSRDNWEGHINKLESNRLRQPDRAMPGLKPLGRKLSNMGLPIQPRRETVIACESEVSSPRQSEMSMMVTVQRRGVSAPGNPGMPGMGGSLVGGVNHERGPGSQSDVMSIVEMASTRGGLSERHLRLESVSGLSVFDEDVEMLDAMDTCTEVDVQVHEPEQGTQVPVKATQGSNPGGGIGVRGGGVHDAAPFFNGYEVRSSHTSVASVGAENSATAEDEPNLGVLGVLLSSSNRKSPSTPPQEPPSEGVGKASMNGASAMYHPPFTPLTPQINEAMYLIGGLDQGYIPTVETFDPESSRWTPCSRLPSGKYICGDIASLGEFIFLVGGDPEVNTGHIYNTLTGNWSRMASLSMGGANLGVGCTTCNGRVYAIGGGVPKNELASVGVYDPNIDRWFEGPDMSCPRFAVGVASEFSLIYACGGFDGDRYLDSIEMLDTREGVWHMLPKMNVPRSSVACVMYDGCIWAIGGDSVDGTMLDSVEVFDTHSGSWHKMAAINETRGYCTAEVFNGDLYVIGGRKSRDDFALAGMERYNKSRSFWEKGYGAGESGARCFHSSCVVRC